MKTVCRSVSKASSSRASSWSILLHVHTFMMPSEEEFQDHSGKASFPAFKTTQAEIPFQLCVLAIFPAAKNPSFSPQGTVELGLSTCHSSSNLRNSSLQKQVGLRPTQTASRLTPTLKWTQDQGPLMPVRWMWGLKLWKTKYKLSLWNTTELFPKHENKALERTRAFPEENWIEAMSLKWSHD